MEAVFTECVDEVRAAGRSVLLSSHILAEVEKLCDTRHDHPQRAHGRERHAGRAAAPDPQHGHRGRRPATRPTWLDLPGVHDLPSRATGVTFLVDTGRARPRVRAAGRARACAAWSAAPPSLEELFLRHYGDELAAIGVPR